MQAILVANPKGGSGKTTMSTNVAGYLAAIGKHVMMLDLDRQKSANLWLAQRDISLPIIWPMQSEKEKTKHADVLVIDSPAGMHGKNLEHAVKLVHKIIVPIAPSLFDIQASHDFLRELSQLKAARKGRVQIGVVGMRMAPRTRAAATLEQFLERLDLPLLGYLREAQAYVNAAFEGKSIFDLPPHLVEQDLEQWADLIPWIES
jgi:chromosome partitioning protein